MESISPGNFSTANTPGLSRTPRIIFLILFIVISFLGNLITIIVSINNIKLRSPRNLLIASMCAACTIDCVFNMTIMTCFLISREWVQVALMCKVSSFFTNFVAIKKMLMLTALSTDRYFSHRFAFKYQAWLTPYRIWSSIAYFWVHSMAFSIPFLTNAVNSVFHPQLYLCMVAERASFVFICIKLFVCFFGPVIIIIFTHILHLKLTCKLKYTQNVEVTEKNYTEMRNKDRHTHQLSLTPSYTMVLFVLWIALETPFLVTSYIQQMEYVENELPLSVTDYSWQVITTFIWMRFFFSAVFPFVTFFCKKEIWQSVKDCILCRRNNSIIDIDALGIAADVISRNENAHKIEKDISSKTKEKDNSETPNSLTFNVPVLFATSSGICIEDASTGHNFSFPDYTGSSRDTVHLKGKSLDISYHNYEYPDELMGNTSDYDSSCEIDQYSSSQPVSSRNVLRALHRTRSLSYPEINFDQSKTKSRNKDSSTTFISDSGLDLSVSSCSNFKEVIQQISRTADIDEPIAGCLSVSQVVADVAKIDRNACCPEKHLAVLQAESTGIIQSNSRSNSKSNSKSNSNISTYDLFDRATLLNNNTDVFFVTGIKSQKTKMTGKHDGNTSASPQRKDISGNVQDVSNSDSSTQNVDERFQSKANIESNYDTSLKGKPGRTKNKGNNKTATHWANKADVEGGDQKPNKDDYRAVPSVVIKI